MIGVHGGMGHRGTPTSNHAPLTTHSLRRLKIDPGLPRPKRVAPKGGSYRIHLGRRKTRHRAMREVRGASGVSHDLRSESPMLSKSYAKNGKTCKVTFKIPAELGAESGAVLGEFNDWQSEANLLTKRKDGSLSTTISLEAGKEYRFRYFLDGKTWMNDEAPDSFAPNRYGGQDCIVTV